MSRFGQLKPLVEKADYASPIKDRVRLAAMYAACLFEAVVFIGSLGFLVSHVRANLIFSDWWIDD